MVDYFKDLKILEYVKSNKLNSLLNVDLNEYGNLEKKFEHTIYGSVDPNNTTSYLPELDDQARLHYLVTSRKAITILEFGVGYSTLVLADALYKNKQKYEEYHTKRVILECYDAMAGAIKTGRPYHQCYS